MQKEFFSSRWGFIFAALGMALGTGNVWRFPRIAAKNGGGVFIIAWIAALFLWSIPILIMEIGMGKNTRKGVIGAFGIIGGMRYLWLGAFAVFCTMGITYYYSVVTGWCLKYFTASFSQAFFIKDSYVYWNAFISGNQPILFHFFSVVLVSIIVYSGVVKGIERANKILIPSLFIFLIFLAFRALLLPGAVNGLNFLFNPDWSKLFDRHIWLEALSQSAWSAGAGWGLMLTYGIYSRQKEDIVLNSFLTGFGNNTASLISAIAVLCTIFAILPEQEALNVVGTDNIGLTFIWLPRLIEKTPGGMFFMAGFFIALSFAAFSSLISMVEMAVRNFIDFGLTRKSAIMVVSIIVFCLGIPSAVSIEFFRNQDWVWGLGLIINGFFMSLVVIKYGVKRFRNDIINTEGNDVRLGIWFDIIVKYIIPLEFLSMIVWWFYQSVTLFERTDWWNPFHVYSIGTCIFQWGIVLIIVLLLNKRMAGKLLQRINNS